MGILNLHYRLSIWIIFIGLCFKDSTMVNCLQQSSSPINMSRESSHPLVNCLLQFSTAIDMSWIGSDPSLNCLQQSSSSLNRSKEITEIHDVPLPIKTIFKLPDALPNWNSGEGFANGSIDLGGLVVAQVSEFNKIWATHEGGPDNLGATFFEPSSIPHGFFFLGSYSQPNNQPLYGWVLVGKDVTGDPSRGALKNPISYTLVWSSDSQHISQDEAGYIWLPTPPEGYKPVGHVVTNSPQMPPLDKIRCVRSDLTDSIEVDTWIWGPKSGFNVYSSRPAVRGTRALGVSTGTFLAQKDGAALSLACLKNVKNNLLAMPTKSQIQALAETYCPILYFHPDEEFFPTSVSWFFDDGAVLYTKGKESNPDPVMPTGANLPQNGNPNDGAYWLNLPTDPTASANLKKGNLSHAGGYLHIKPMLGATFTDIVVWIFYPFNGAAKLKLEFINLSLGKVGEHVGDWEHVTLRISNFNGELKSVYFSQHSKGTWVSCSELEYEFGNKPLVYASLHGHASFPHGGLVVNGKDGIGVRNDMAKGMRMDAGARFVLIGTEYLGPSSVIVPPWLNYAREWGPRIKYSINDLIQKIKKLLPNNLKADLDKLVSMLPPELLGEEGPTGPKWKDNWSGDERV